MADICLLKIFGNARVSLIALNPSAGFGDLDKNFPMDGTFLSFPISKVLIVNGFSFKIF